MGSPLWSSWPCFSTISVACRFFALGAKVWIANIAAPWSPWGKWLCYHVVIHNTFIFLKLSLMDQGDEPELILSVADVDREWRELFKIIRAFERDQIKSLERPIQLGGGSGPNGWAIC
jgi:hypothetical protein